MPDSARASAPPPNRVTPPETPSPIGLLTLGVGVIVLAALYFGREVFIPIVIAVLLSFVLAPLVNLLRHFHLGRIGSVFIAVVTALGIVLALAGVIGLQVAQLATDLPQYQSTVQRKVAALKEGTLGRAADLLKNAGREIRRAAEEAPAPPTPAPSSRPAEAASEKPLPVEVRERDPTPVELLHRVLAPVLHPIATTGIVFVVVVFILLQREDLRDRMIRLFGSSDLHRTTVAMDDAARRLSRYFLTQLALNAAFGAFIGLGLFFIGVPSPVLWGIFAALMRFVPYIGSFIAGAFPVALAAAVDPGWSMAVWTFLLFAIGEPIMGHVVEPLVYGQSTGLSPFAVLVAAFFWTWLWGPVGLLLATPLTVCLVVLGRHVEHLEFLDVLFGDRPALTPVENFYQRMLAGDPDEAQEHAEELLKERSLLSYYDEVALKGLQLAANDAGRGVLTSEQLDRIKEAIKELVDDLANREDVEPEPKDKSKPDNGPADDTLAEKAVAKTPPPDTARPEALPPEWRAENAVLCVAGRGPLDEAAAAMLTQLLRKHGLGARMVPHDAVSRSNIVHLDTARVMMVCVSYLEISGSPAHLRYLVRRMRQKLPKAPLLVGLWPAEEALLKDETLRAEIGADYYVSSLREAVKACLEAAQKAGLGRDEGQGGESPATADPAASRARAAAAARI